MAKAEEGTQGERRHGTSGTKGSSGDVSGELVTAVNLAGGVDEGEEAERWDSRCWVGAGEHVV